MYGTLKEQRSNEDVHVTPTKKRKFVSLFRYCFPIGFKNELKEVIFLAWPAIVTSFCRFFNLTISIIMCGHLSKLELDAAALGNSIINVFGLSIGMGLSTATDTVFSQTFGSKNKKRMGMFLQRFMILMTLTFCLLAAIHINIELVLLLAQQHPLVAKLTSHYILIYVPGLFFDFSFLTVARYLQNQNIVYPPMVCGLIGLIFNGIAQYICIYVIGFDFRASAACLAISQAVMFFTQLIYIVWSKVYEDTWSGFQLKEALCDWGIFFKLGVPGILMIGLEEWSFEISTLVSGFLGLVQLGAQSIIFQVEALTYMIPLGIAIAVNIRVGQQLGAKEPKGASLSFQVGVFTVMTTATFVAFWIVILKDYLPKIFTNDKEIVEYSASILPLMALFQYFDGLSAVGAGALRGCGRQAIGAFIVFVGYYLISTPLGLALTFAADMGVMGIWLGLCLGIGIEAIFFVFVVFRTRWENYCEMAAELGVEYTQEDDEGTDASLSTEKDALCWSDPGTSPRRSRSKTRKVLYTSRFRSQDRMSVTRALTVKPIADKTSSILFRRLIIILIVIAFPIASMLYRIYGPYICIPLSERENGTDTSHLSFVIYCNSTIPSNFTTG